jgi:hypothetical protein
MSGVELALAFLAGVVMGGALDRFVLPPTGIATEPPRQAGRIACRILPPWSSSRSVDAQLQRVRVQT